MAKNDGILTSYLLWPNFSSLGLVEFLKLFEFLLKITTKLKTPGLLKERFNLLEKNLDWEEECLRKYIAWDDPLEEEMATYSSILAWEIPWTEEPGGTKSQTWLSN